MGEGWGEGDERSHLLPLSLTLSREGRGDLKFGSGYAGLGVAVSLWFETGGGSYG